MRREVALIVSRLEFSDLVGAARKLSFTVFDFGGSIPWESHGYNENMGE